jgi:hypothetical protein
MLIGQSVHQLIHVALGDGIDLVKREVDAMVGDAALRIVIGADAL